MQRHTILKYTICSIAIRHAWLLNKGFLQYRPTFNKISIFFKNFKITLTKIPRFLNNIKKLIIPRS